MEARDLRLGNRIEQGIVHSVGYHMGHSGYYGVYILEHEFSSGPSIFIKNDDIKPIDLTEQWLLDFGLEKIMEDLFKIKVSMYTALYWSYNKCYVSDGFTEIRFPKEYAHVHDLQNLYYNLSGKELTKKQ